jgi:hypothetical protein
MSIKAKWTATLALAIATIPPGLAQTNDPGIEQAKVILATKLKDGASARFLGVVHAPSKSGGAGIVCGWVNARNSFGGYVGYKPFVVSGDTVMIRDESQDQFNNKSTFDMYWFHGCFPDTNEQIGYTVVQLSKINIAKQCAKLRKSLPDPSNESHCEDTEARLKLGCNRTPRRNGLLTIAQRRAASTSRITQLRCVLREKRPTSSSVAAQQFPSRNNNNN